MKFSLLAAACIVFPVFIGWLHTLRQPDPDPEWMRRDFGTIPQARKEDRR